MSGSISYAQIVKAIDELVAENARLRAQIAAGSTSARSNAKKLTKRDVGLMKDLKRLGSTNTELATAFDVNRATVLSDHQGDLSPMTEKQELWDWLKAENHYIPKDELTPAHNRRSLRARRFALRRKGK